MFTDLELNEYATELERLGILDKTQQEKVLEYFFQLGKIIYKINVGRYEEEN